MSNKNTVVRMNPPMSPTPKDTGLRRSRPSLSRKRNKERDHLAWSLRLGDDLSSAPNSTLENGTESIVEWEWDGRWQTEKWLI
jgi:hypothetical protein